MYKCAYYIIFLFTISTAAFSQINFTGRVISDKTGVPIAGASVYFNNTSFGTSTNVKGEFSIAYPDISKPELIIFSVGFEVISYSVPTIITPGKQYIFKLKSKEKLLQDVLILSDANRKRYLKLFVDNFLGITEEAASSTIKNLRMLYFIKPSGEKDAFNALSDTPLVIINKKLGYKITFDLQSFYLNQQNGECSFYGFTRYEDLGNKKRYIKNRKKAYYGSTMHFFRSLIRNTLDKEFFKVYRIQEDTLREQAGNRIINIAIPVTTAQIIKQNPADSSSYEASWKKKLIVQYNRDPSSKAYLQQRTFISESLPTGFRSYLLIRDTHVVINKDGILDNPLSVFFSGYWIYEKVANLLPYNYDPENKTDN